MPILKGGEKIANYYEVFWHTSGGVNYADSLEDAVGIVRARYPKVVLRKKSAIETVFFKSREEQKDNSPLGTITIKQKRKHAKSKEHKE